MKAEPFWAHSAELPGQDSGSRAGWQLLADHLLSVSAMARRFAAAARPGDEALAKEAALCGLLHDYGKYTDCFQRRITTGQGRCPHAVHGAQLAFLTDDGKPARPHLLPAAFAIAGHHSGLPDLDGGSGSLQHRLKTEQHRMEGLSIRERACQDCPQIGALLEAWRENKEPRPAMNPAQIDLRTRMLFSCLVDADRLDSAGRRSGDEPLMPEDRLAALLDYVEDLQGRARQGIVTELRRGVLEDCLNAARLPSALFSLSVPTGGGKTLSAMAFALKRAALDPGKFRRVIVVIPYLSIIEQNAEVYARVFGRDAVLEHHSGAFEPLTRRDDEHWNAAPEEHDEGRDQQKGIRPETENWDAPLIVTTSVRFFESLFSNRPSDLRRVHNIARSVVILDEVQTLPRRLITPLLSMMKDLADHWGCSFVFSTATLPAFENSGKTGGLWKPGAIQEIVQKPDKLRRSLRRAEILWETDKPWSWEQVAERMLARSQALCVVNVRDHARSVYAALRQMATERGLSADAVSHLSTRMCAAHRLRRIGEIKARLESGFPCWVASTQLVEAGVDLDFPLVMRAIAPLESIIQAAGRADREGKLTAERGRPGGEVIVFRPADDRMPPNEYKEAAELAGIMARNAQLSGSSIQVDSADELRRYYQRYYGEAGENALGRPLEEMRSPRNLEFATLAGKFEMISSRTLDVFIPDDEDARAAIGRLRAIGELTWELRRKLQRHVVGLLPYEFDRARDVLEQLELRGGTKVWIAMEYSYSDSTGLDFHAGTETYVV